MIVEVFQFFSTHPTLERRKSHFRHFFCFRCVQICCLALRKSVGEMFCAIIELFCELCSLCKGASLRESFRTVEISYFDERKNFDLWSSVFCWQKYMILIFYFFSFVPETTNLDLWTLAFVDEVQNLNLWSSAVCWQKGKILIFSC